MSILVTHQGEQVLCQMIHDDCHTHAFDAIGNVVTMNYAMFAKYPAE